MSLHRVARILGLACILLLSASAQNPVHIQYSSEVTQLLTSSTLAWIPHSKYYNSKIPRDIVIAGFEVTEHIVASSPNYPEKTITRESPIYVCRVQHEGTWVAGGQKQGDRKCTVGFLGNLRSYDRYELLENVDSAGRLSWTTWNKFTLPPDGMVAVREEKLYVARHSINKTQTESQEVKYTTHCIGTLTLEEGFGKIVCAQDGRIQKMFDDGEILVETEPQKYDLTKVRLNNNKKRIIKFVPQILGQATIKNPGPNTAKMAEAFGYSYNYSVYWGQVRAMSKGMDTSITLLDGTRLHNIKWGIEDRGNETTVYTVNVILEPGTAVNVTLKANYTELEASYTGDLISHYADSTTRSRSINGFRREENMTDIQVELSPVYFLSNFSVVPTTEPPPPTTTTEQMTTTTTVLPTTTMTTTKRAPQPPILMSGVDEKVSKDEEVDENMIMSPKKTDVNMQGGDGGPLSLKDRSEAGRSSTGPLVPALALPLILILSVNRIT